MSIQAHIDSLAKKRFELKQRIALESNRPSPDFALITALKKHNLHIKEEMRQALILLSSQNASTG